jgi:hypothetical protein
MPVKTFNNEYPVIDTDPHFFRVVRYFRSSDYAAWAAGTAAAPGLLLAMGKSFSPTPPMDKEKPRLLTVDTF